MRLEANPIVTATYAKGRQKTSDATINGPRESSGVRFLVLNAGHGWGTQIGHLKRTINIRLRRFEDEMYLQQGDGTSRSCPESMVAQRSTTDRAKAH